MQAGVMFEQITGGYVKAGFHEVVYTEQTKAIVEKKLEENKNGKNPEHILWRISSTLFGHLRHDVDISPMAELKELHDKKNMEEGKYKNQTARERLFEELDAVILVPKDDEQV